MGDNGKRLADFVAWLETNGADLSKVELRAGGGGGGNGVYALQDIGENERYAWIPHSLAITGNVCVAALGVADERLTDRPLLAAFLVHERFVNKRSFWKPYIDILPEASHTPMEFTAEERKLLRGTPLEHAVDDRLRKYREEHELTKQATGMSDEALSFERFVWAMGAVSSRSFSKDLVVGITGAGNEVLLPLLDMMNHMPMRKVSWIATDAGIEFVTGSAIPRGAQVLNNYGPKSNEELLMGYGFCVRHNPFSFYHIRLNYSRDPMARNKHALLERARLADTNHFIRKSALPGNLMPMLRVMAMTDTDVRHLERVDDGAEATAMGSGLGLRIELRARYLLEHLLTQKLELLRQNTRPCARPSTNASLALAYRGELGDILAATLDNLRAAESELAEFACRAFEEGSHALPLYMVATDTGLALPELTGDCEQPPVRPPTPTIGDDTEPAESHAAEPRVAKRPRTSAYKQQFVESVLLTTRSFASDPAFAAVVGEVDIDDDVLLALFVARILITPLSPWHAAVKRLETFMHPMLWPETKQSDAVEELDEIYATLFPLLSSHFPDTLPIEHFSRDRFLWAAGVVEALMLMVPNGDAEIEGVCLI